MRPRAFPYIPVRLSYRATVMPLPASCAGRARRIPDAHRRALEQRVEPVVAKLGIGNLAGAMVGGILLGIIEALGGGYIGDLTGGVLGSNYQDIFAFIVLIIVLTLRPKGLLGERVADRA